MRQEKKIFAGASLHLFMSGAPDNGSRIKSAASLLLKGGTLVSDPCEKCGGVQVKFADKITCINCGYEAGQRKARPQVAEAKKPANLESAAAVIEAKISAVASELAGEKDTSVQKQKSELLEAYLRILEKMRALSRSD
jgi:uncharacterized Zn finger protein (UPF0148 family)